MSPGAGDGKLEQRRFGFPHTRRLTRGPELDVVRREGKRVRTEHLEVRVLASLSSFGVSRSTADAGAAPAAALARVGIIVPKHRQSSVARNLVKRRLRELARTRLLPTLDALGAASHDTALVVRAWPSAYGAPFDALARDVERAGEQAVREMTRPPRAPRAAPLSALPATPATPDPSSGDGSAERRDVPTGEAS